jgi:hypothetical protein
MAASLRAAILPYKSSFVPSKLPLVKQKQDFQDGSSKDKKCPIFNKEHCIYGSSKDKKCPIFNKEHCIEALFYVEEWFRKKGSGRLAVVYFFG